MPKRRALSRIARFAAFALAIAAALWIYRPQEHRLMDRAKPLHAASTRLVSGAYFWLSPTSILSFCGPHRVDVSSGKCSEMPGFTPKYVVEINSGETDPFARHPVTSLTPDARWLLCPGFIQGWAAYSLDGHRSATWRKIPRQGILDEPVWLNDHEFLILPDVSGLNSTAYRCDLSISESIYSMPFGQSFGAEYAGILPNNAIRSTTGNAEFRFTVGIPPDELQYTDIALNSGSPRLSRGTFRLPCAATVDDLRFSPNRHRIAWGLHCDRRVRGPEWYRKIAGWIGMRDRQTWELWTSDVNGYDWREVGYIDCSKSNTFPYQLQWTPDSRQLSFLKEKTLYVVEAG